MGLAEMVQNAARDFDLNVEIDHLPDPRVEAEEHYYNAKHTKLVDLGLVAHRLSESLLDSLVNIAITYRDRVDPTLFVPSVNWRRSRNARRASDQESASPVAAARNGKPAHDVQAAVHASAESRRYATAD
jgi:UDP-sulfoquinovose synthase